MTCSGACCKTFFSSDHVTLFNSSSIPSAWDQSRQSRCAPGPHGGMHCDTGAARPGRTSQTAAPHPLQYLPQDPLTGLPEHRRARLEKVFAVIDKVRGCAGGPPPQKKNSTRLSLLQPNQQPACLLCCQDAAGGISMRKLQAFANKYGGESLSTEELSLVFADFRSADASIINIGAYFDGASCRGHACVWPHVPMHGRCAASAAWGGVGVVVVARGCPALGVCWAAAARQPRQAVPSARRTVALVRRRVPGLLRQGVAHHEQRGVQ